MLPGVRSIELAGCVSCGTAVRDFRWPELTHFNWALDYFDALAVDNGRAALWVVDESGSEQKLSFAELSARSNQVANWLRVLGVGRGDRILLMLGNVVPLWETMLAAMKVGAVVIPASTLLVEADLRDRLERGQVKHVLVGAAQAAKFAALPSAYTKIVVGGEAAGWTRFADAARASASFNPDDPTHADDPLLLYLAKGRRPAGARPWWGARGE